MSYIDGKDAVPLSIEAVNGFPDYEKYPALMEYLSFLYQQAGDYDKAFSLIVEIDKKTKQTGAKVFECARMGYSQKYFTQSAIASKYIINNFPSGPFQTQSRI